MCKYKHMKNTKQTQSKLGPDHIRGELIKVFGIGYAAALAKKSGKSNSWVSRHISGTLTTDEGQELIASAIGRTVAQTFQQKAAQGGKQ